MDCFVLHLFKQKLIGSTYSLDITIKTKTKEKLRSAAIVILHLEDVYLKETSVSF